MAGAGLTRVIAALLGLAVASTPGATQETKSVRAILDALGHPENAFRSVHVAGTNGKGSVCAMLDALCRAVSLTYSAKGCESASSHSGTSSASVVSRITRLLIKRAMGTG